MNIPPFKPIALRVVLLCVAVIVIAGLSVGGSPTGPTEPRPIAGGTFEASGVVHVPGTDGVLFVDDGHTREIFWMELGPDGSQRGPAVAVPLGADVTDPEALTTDGTHFFVVGSQSKREGFDGDGLVRFRFDPAKRRVEDARTVRDLKGFLATHVAELEGTARLVGDEVLNIEGLAWDPPRERLLLGLRAPVVDGQTLVVPLRMRDRSGPFSPENLEVEGGRAIRLPLDGAGIRSLEFEERTGSFRIITGAEPDPETRTFRLLEWSGRPGEPPSRELMRFPRTLKPEGITSARIAGHPHTVLVFDTSRFILLD